MTNEIYQSAVEYEEFHQLADKLAAHKCADDAYIIGERAGGIDLALMGITHGDEVAGLALMNELLRKLLRQRHDNVKLPISLALILGNYQATMKGVRFIERDLNRCFDLRDNTSLEGQRAHQLAPLLQSCRYLIDFHQTAERSAHSFSIFPFSEKNLAWARAVHGDYPIVTRFGAGEQFSAAGMCTDEYVLQQGNIGITIELGQKGYDPPQIKHGLKVACQAVTQVAQVAQVAQGGITTARTPIDLYITAETVNFPDDGVFQLAPDLYNFKPLAKGDLLATFSDQQLTCAIDGYALFPKYHINRSSPPSEICHVLKKLRY